MFFVLKIYTKRCTKKNLHTGSDIYPNTNQVEGNTTVLPTVMGDPITPKVQVQVVFFPSLSN